MKRIIGLFIIMLALSGCYSNQEAFRLHTLYPAKYPYNSKCYKR